MVSYATSGICSPPTRRVLMMILMYLTKNIPKPPPYHLLQSEQHNSRCLSCRNPAAPIQRHPRTHVTAPLTCFGPALRYSSAKEKGRLVRIMLVVFAFSLKITPSARGVLSRRGFFYTFIISTLLSWVLTYGTCLFVLPAVDMYTVIALLNR